MTEQTDLVPKRRFKEFLNSHAWEQREVGELTPLRGGFAFQSSNFVEYGVPIVKISNILSNGEVGGEFDYYNEQELDDNYLLIDGSALLAMSGATTGKVSILKNPSNIKVYQNQRVGYFMDNGIADYSFISTIVRSNLFTNKLKSVLVAGAQPNVSSKDIDSLEFSIPIDMREQKSIGIFFNNLDNLINLHQRKLEKTKALKSAYLSEMFPVEGEREPKRRFAGFTGAWEQRELSDLMIFSNGINAPKENYGKGRKMISVMDILAEESLTYEKIRNSVRVEKKIEEKNKVENGDLVFVRSSEVSEEVGWAKAYLQDEYALYSGFSIRGKRKNNYDAYFIELSLNNVNRKHIESKAGGSTRFNVSQEILNSIIILEPSLDEQAEISGFFTQLDHLITLHQRKLEKLQNLKKAYLNEMFV